MQENLAFPAGVADRLSPRQQSCRGLNLVAFQAAVNSCGFQLQMV